MLRQQFARNKSSLRSILDPRRKRQTLQPCNRRTAAQHERRTPFSAQASPAATVSREELLAEAAAITKSLYRTCLRSVGVIRWGNEFDEKEFAKRDKEFSDPSSSMGVLSMSPPPNRTDELRSRAEYYQSYAREYFIQESDCLDNDPLQERDVRRFVYYLRKGEKDRKWLLGDMMFPDPYQGAFDSSRVERFEEMGKVHLGLEEAEDEEPENPMRAAADSFFDEDEDPEWFQKNYPHLK